MKKLLWVIALLPFSAILAQTPGPEVSTWIQNTTKTGYGGVVADVQLVRYSADSVYVTCTDIPDYTIGPWPGNPNIAKNQNFTYRIPRHPQMNSGTAVTVPLGHTGVWKNGVSIFNTLDAMSYQNQNVWHQNAEVVEGPGFDACGGHPNQQGEYHHHVNPACLYNSQDSSKHSPLLGFAFDGFPVYGAFAYDKTNGTGSIRRMKSSYRMRNITQRTSLPDGTQLSSNEYGPSVSSQYPLGYYAEDFEFVTSLGDLDEHNGRFCVTPEYPAGTYAYFATLDETGKPAYPYSLGLTYYGTVPPGNMGPNSGHNTPKTQQVNTYLNIMETAPMLSTVSVYPNPVTDDMTLNLPGEECGNLCIRDLSGRTVISAHSQKGILMFSMKGRPSGLYLLNYITESGKFFSAKIIKE